ncbi:hypothetical protein EDC04DRAFT_2894152 [Pisolithus marmoratus]|nr:hypothetical protein EDC04DRAFT_2894152 [Pisolithus marmoratus]
MADTATEATYVTSLIGPVIVSLVLSGVLYGCALVQTHVYYKLFPKDNWRFKALVAFEMVFQTVQLILLFLGVWETVMTLYSQDQMSTVLIDILIIGMIFGGPSAFCVQAFFIFRLYSFSQRKPLPILCSILITVQLAFTLTIGAASSEVVALQKWQGFIVSALFVSICADTIIATSMSYYLRGSRTGFHETSRLIDRMVLYVLGEIHLPLNTISLVESSPSITALLAGITFYVIPNTYVWLAFGVLEAGLYANSLLAALNARVWLSHTPSTSESITNGEISIT